jgi:hypothetical protein
MEGTIMTDASDRTTVSRNGFIKALLEPLPAAALVDTHYNSLMRQIRREAWWQADAKTKLMQAKLQLWRAEECFARRCEGAPMRANDSRLVADYRAAIADQILVPAPDQLSVKWKKDAAKDRYLPITRDTIDSAIAADEQWLAAHPVNCRKRKSTG